MTETPPELKRRVDALLANLAKVSEAKASAAMDARTGGHTKPDSSPPPGFREGRRKRPDPDESLLDWFIWRLQEAGVSVGLQMAAVEEGEIRYSKRVKKPDDLSPGAFGGVASAEKVETRDKRIAEDYEGLTPEEVAIVERHRAGYVHPANVRKCRRLAHRDPESGMPNPDAAPGREREKVKQLKTEHPHLSVRQIAQRVGMSKTTVGRYLSEDEGAAA